MEAAREPVIITEKTRMRNWSRAMRSKGKTIALVPTMGYLHEGHLALVKEAHKHADMTVISIYVNPGQFSPTEDLSTYPSDFQGDILKLNSVPGGVDAVFHPYNLYDYGTDDRRNEKSGENVGGNIDNNGNCDLEGKGVVSCVEEKGMENETWIRVERLEKGLCGKSRPVFFRGVATVCAKLFNIVEPDFAVFGKKDYQQWRTIQRLVRDLDFSIEIIGSEIVRENNGLAMSSRNVRLSDKEREQALSISRSLFKARSSAKEGHIDCIKLKGMVIQEITEAGGKVDYAEIVEQKTLEAVEEIEGPVVFCVAAWFGKVRLIDNIEIDI